MLIERFDQVPGYDPVNFLDTLIRSMQLKNDAALARSMDVKPPIISKIRNRKAPVTAAFILRAHEVSKLPTKTLRRWLAKHQ